MPDDAGPGVAQPRGLFVAAAIVIVLASVRAATAIVVPVVIAVLVTVVAAPFQQRLIARGMHRLGAFGIVLAATGVIVAGFFWAVDLSLSAFLADLPSYAPGAKQLLTDMLNLGKSVHLDFTHLVSVGSLVSKTFTEADTLTRSILSSIAGWVIALTLTGFMLHEALDFPGKVRSLLKDDSQFNRLAAFARDLSGSMAIMTVGAALTAAGDLAVLVVLGVPSALLWAALAFLLSYIPSIGSIIIVIPPTIATLVRFGLSRALLVLVLMLVIDNVVGILIVPRLVRRRLDITPLWGMLSLVFWGWLLGPAGAILAIPLTMFAKFLLESSPTTASLARLMAPLTVTDT